VSDVDDTVRAAAARVPQGRVPDFFIVGHAKCGTTALYRTLRRHPQIYVSAVKEPRFFTPDLRTSYRTFDDYLSLFAAATPDQRAGEASTDYIWSPTAAARIADAQPAARIIAILREPASFLRSLHLHMLRTRRETEKSLRKAMDLEGARREGRHVPSVVSDSPQLLMYSERVQYVEQLRRYHDVFAPEQVLVLIYEDYLRDSDATFRTVLRFLEVDDTYPIEVVNANQTVRVRSRRVEDLVNAVAVGRGPVGRATKATVKALTPRRLRDDAFQLTRRRVVYGSPRSPDERFMLELRRRFKGEVVALSERLGRDLVSLWGYDSLG
jgi:hypothetical protein